MSTSFLQLRADISHYSSVSMEMWQKVQVSYPKLNELVTSSEGNGTIEQAIDQITVKGYQYGREWLKLQVCIVCVSACVHACTTRQHGQVVRA